jgi:hypothetical protein
MLLCVEYGDGKTSYLVAEPSMLKEARHKASKKGESQVSSVQESVVLLMRGAAA